MDVAQCSIRQNATPTTKSYSVQTVDSVVVEKP